MLNRDLMRDIVSGTTNSKAMATSKQCLIKVYVAWRSGGDLKYCNDPVPMFAISVQASHFSAPVALTPKTRKKEGRSQEVRVTVIYKLLNQTLLFSKRSALSKRTRTLGHYHTEPY